VQLGTTRLPALAAVPTSTEAGAPEFLAETWWGVLAPARTPPALIERMQAEVAAVFREERVARLVTEVQQARLLLDGPAAMRAFLDGQIATWGAVIRDHKILAD